MTGHKRRRHSVERGRGGWDCRSSVAVVWQEGGEAEKKGGERRVGRVCLAKQPGHYGGHEHSEAGSVGARGSRKGGQGQLPTVPCARIWEGGDAVRDRAVADTSGEESF